MIELAVPFAMFPAVFFLLAGVRAVNDKGMILCAVLSAFFLIVALTGEPLF